MLLLNFLALTAQAQVVEIRPALVNTPPGIGVEYRSGKALIGRSTESAPAGVELLLPGAGGKATPVPFRNQRVRRGVIELGPTRIGALTLRLKLTQRTPSLVERTLEVRADHAQRFAVTFPLDLAIEGDYASFSGPEKARVLCDTVRGSARTETFPVGMVRTSDNVFGIAADSPGLWENRCQVLLDPPGHRLAVLTGDGRDPYPLIVKPPEDARDTYQYQMDGWQSLAAGETRRFTTWVFASPARNHYDAQVAAHLAVANGKGWNSSALEAILRNTSLFLLRRNLALDANNQPRDGRYIFISGPGYGWKQWVSDGFYCALGLDDPEKTIESNRAVFWTRMDYEDNAHYYLIWAVLMKRAGGTINEPLVRKAYQFIRSHETNGLFVPPSLPGAPSPKGWKTYHDLLEYDDDDSPASTHGFHCGALIAAKELGLGVTDADIERSIAAYRSLFNTERGFMPTSRKQNDTLGQDTLYGATLTYAVFGRKLLTDEIVLTHVRTSEKVKSPYGLRVISQADGSLMPGHSGSYVHGGSWFLNDAANYLLAGAHGMPAAEVDALLIQRIGLEIAYAPAFNESISTVTGKPHGHILYSWNSGYWWLRKEIRRRLGQTGPDPVEAAIDARLGVVREKGVLRLDPDEAASPALRTNASRIGARPILSAPKFAASPAANKPSANEPLLGYTELRTDLPGGRQANIRTMRACVVKADGSGRREVASLLIDEPNAWTQFAGWSPDGKQAIVLRGWEDPENARWEEEHKTFRMDPGQVAARLVPARSGLRPADQPHRRGAGQPLQRRPLLPPGRPRARLHAAHQRRVQALPHGPGRPEQAQCLGQGRGLHLRLQRVAGRPAHQLSRGIPGLYRQRRRVGEETHRDRQPVQLRPRLVPRRPMAALRQRRARPQQPLRRAARRHRPAQARRPQRLPGLDPLPRRARFPRGQQRCARLGHRRQIRLLHRPGRQERRAVPGHPGRQDQAVDQTPEGTLHYHPKPSPDGQWLAYGSKRAGVRQLYVMRLSDHSERRLTNLQPGHAAMWAHWQPSP